MRRSCGNVGPQCRTSSSKASAAGTAYKSTGTRTGSPTQPEEVQRVRAGTTLPVIVGSVFLFICGAALAWYFVLPMTLKFLFGLGNEAFDQMITVSQWHEVH